MHAEQLTADDQSILEQDAGDETVHGDARSAQAGDKGMKEIKTGFLAFFRMELGAKDGFPLHNGSDPRRSKL